MPVAATDTHSQSQHHCHNTVDVLDCVADGTEAQVAVWTHVEHVIQERDPRVRRANARSVQVYADIHLGLLGLPLHGSHSRCEQPQPARNDETAYTNVSRLRFVAWLVKAFGQEHHIFRQRNYGTKSEALG